MLPALRLWLCHHGLLCPRSGKRLQKFMWCTDGPFDLRDFLVKQCFISKVCDISLGFISLDLDPTLFLNLCFSIWLIFSSQTKLPEWLRYCIMDVRKVVTDLVIARELSPSVHSGTASTTTAPAEASHEQPHRPYKVNTFDVFQSVPDL